jgi:PIN domain nuclease of toxin-antitoxin system
VLADPAVVPLVSAASVWEIAIKRSLGKLEAPDDLPERIAEEGFVHLPIEAAHAWSVRDLPWHHRDPFDRLLLAQALTEGVPVLSADEQLAAYGISVRW